MKRNLRAITITIVLTILGVTSAVMLYQYTHTAKLEKQVLDKQSQLQTKSEEIKKKSEQLNLTEQQKVELQKQIEELNKAKTDLEAQLQAKLAEKQRLASIAPKQAQAAPQTTTATYSLPANEAKAFIYQHESGNNPNAVNSQGCRGLGQACPGSKLPCGADYACQDAYFTNYAMSRYGSWENAYSFWVAHRWW